MNTPATNDTEPAYSPLVVMGLFNNALSVPQSKRLLLIKGVYQAGKGANYNGSFYDVLRDEYSDAYLSMIVPVMLRSRLQVGKTITFWGFVTKKLVNTGGRIEIQLNMTELVEQAQTNVSEEEHAVFEVLQNKALSGYRDVSGFIKKSIIEGRKVKIVILIGRSAIIDSDIKHQLRESISWYNIEFSKINLSSEQELLQAIQQFNNDEVNVLVVARGGGENLSVFNKPALADACTKLKPYFMTAIGHKEDVTLMQKIADKSFITPSELGQFLNEMYNQTHEELANSKAQLTEAVKKQLETIYQQQVYQLREQIKGLESLKEKSANDLRQVYEVRITGLENRMKHEDERHTQELKNAEIATAERLKVLQKQLSERKTQPINWAAIIFAIIIGLLIGYLLKH